MLNWKQRFETKNRFRKYRDKITKLDTLSPQLLSLLKNLIAKN